MSSYGATIIQQIWSGIQTGQKFITPSGRSSFEVCDRSDDLIKIKLEKSTLLIPLFSFINAVNYLHSNQHSPGNRCVIGSATDPTKASEFCKASRVTVGGSYGPRVITYILPILQHHQVVGIDSSAPNQTWLFGAITDMAERSSTPGHGSQFAVGDDVDVDVDDESDALSKEHSDFADFLASMWFNKDVMGTDRRWEHCYAISNHYSWKQWKVLVQDPEACHWWCSSLSEAAAGYSWTINHGRRSFAALAMQLQNALANNDDSAAKLACLDIFKWGGVGRKSSDRSRIWVENQAAKGSLCSSILHATSILKHRNGPALPAFDGATLLMNSAMTKIYSAASPAHILMYDGRVGAALGLLVGLWLTGRQHAGSRVPTDLAFRWGPASVKPMNRRNPSVKPFCFSSLYSGSDRDLKWAQLVVTGSQILELTSRRLFNRLGIVVTLDQLEKALFMIGADVKHLIHRPTCSRCAAKL